MDPVKEAKSLLVSSLSSITSILNDPIYQNEDIMEGLCEDARRLLRIEANIEKTLECVKKIVDVTNTFDSVNGIITNKDPALNVQAYLAAMKKTKDSLDYLNLIGLSASKLIIENLQALYLKGYERLSTIILLGEQTQDILKSIISGLIALDRSLYTKMLGSYDFMVCDALINTINDFLNTLSQNRTEHDSHHGTHPLISLIKDITAQTKEYTERHSLLFVGAPEINQARFLSLADKFLSTAFDGLVQPTNSNLLDLFDIYRCLRSSDQSLQVIQLATTIASTHIKSAISTFLTSINTFSMELDKSYIILAIKYICSNIRVLSQNHEVVNEIYGDQKYVDKYILKEIGYGLEAFHSRNISVGEVGLILCNNILYISRKLRAFGISNQNIHHDLDYKLDSFRANYVDYWTATIAVGVSEKRHSSATHIVFIRRLNRLVSKNKNIPVITHEFRSSIIKMLLDGTWSQYSALLGSDDSRRSLKEQAYSMEEMADLLDSMFPVIQEDVESIDEVGLKKHDEWDENIPESKLI